MDDIVDLIRSLATTPAGESPLDDPMELIQSRMFSETVHDTLDRGVVSAPQASVNTPVTAAGEPAHITPRIADSREQADPAMRVNNRGPAVDVATPRAYLAPQAQVQDPGKASGQPAVAVPLLRFVGQQATPAMIRAYEGQPADVRMRQPTTVGAQASPAIKTTMVIPPAFPYDPSELFAQVDEVINSGSPPPPVRDLATLLPLHMQSSEQLVAHAFFQHEGGRQTLERFSL